MLIPPEELRHLNEGAGPDEKPGGVGLVEVVVRTRTDAQDVLDRCRDVLRPILKTPQEDWGIDGLPLVDLPDWFVSDDLVVGAPTASDRWELSQWLSWLHPEERQWYWWDASARRSDELVVLVEVPGWPYALGALECLLRAAGGESIELAD